MEFDMKYFVCGTRFGCSFATADNSQFPISLSIGLLL